MKSLILGSPLIAAFLTLSCLAQETKPATPAPAEKKPTERRRSVPVNSPEIAPDGSVTFRCKAAKATEVKVVGEFGPDAAMTKGEGDVWSVTIPQVKPGVHEYRFVIDGMATIDSQNRDIKPQRWPNTSILHIPATPPAPWDIQDIPHGILHELNYKSKALEKWRKIVVYTPPGDDTTPRPVLYLSHGFSDNEGSWSAHGKAHWIMDALIAEKKVVPMIIVMPDAHALPPGPGYRDDYSSENTKAFCQELVTDVIPLVEKSFKVAATPDSRAFAGLSMGGHHALTVAMTLHDQIHSVGAFSSAPPPNSLIESGLGAVDKVNADLKVFWIACGDKDFLFQRNNDFTKMLKEKGIKHDYAVTEGNHSWPVWRRYLVEFSPKLFR